MNIFQPANILLPNVASMERWAVIACDQFTSQPEYWARVRDTANGVPSAINLILPESDLGSPSVENQIKTINKTMRSYLEENIFAQYTDALIYVERTLKDNSIRKGLVGKVDLEAYDYHAGSVSPIRATEKTVEERIPPRMQVRRDASIELPHILVLCDDDKKCLIEPITEKKASFKKVYDFDLMEGGGHICGWLVSEDETRAFADRLQKYQATVDEKYADIDGAPVVFAVGDGNHSLATAKACYEELKQKNPNADFSAHPARYALVELENIHDDAQSFEPIHRIITDTEPEKLLQALTDTAGAENGCPITWFAGNKQGTITLNVDKGQLPIGVLQNFLDIYLATHAGEIDYIHGDDTVKTLSAQAGAVGFLLPAMEKGQLFRGVISDGVLPRKTFSMGHAEEKRYYLEARKIQEK